MERVVNIIGFGVSNEAIPDTGERWIVNVTYKKVRKADKLFFMDDFDLQLQDDVNIEPKDYKLPEFLKDSPNVEIISKYEGEMKTPEGEVLCKVKAFPVREATKLIPGGYFTSTIAYMLAYAIMEKVDRIRLYGFEMWSGLDNNEYYYQRPCVDFWIAFALGRGIKVEIPYYLMPSAGTNSFYGFIPKDRITREVCK